MGYRVGGVREDKRTSVVQFALVDLADLLRKSTTSMIFVVPSDVIFRYFEGGPFKDAASGEISSRN